MTTHLLLSGLLETPALATISILFVLLVYLTAATCFGPYSVILSRNIQFWLLEIITLTTDPLFCVLFSLRVLNVARFTVCFYGKIFAVVNFIDVCVRCYVRCS
jgi:hypothetical protein